ncbi:MAG: tripartite tricarboxylate transporter substrate binding protein BugD, partial [Betaproteobacteria bacterium]|nr:tripartite tricarboxylate transporter substrate binding protein BugD [Betaproteobacteria bacterium]
MMSQPRTILSTALFLLLLATAALAQEYPVKPVTIVVPAAAGGPTDTLARVLAAAMSEPLKTQVLIDNSGGAGGTIGINKVAKARPDGYTLLLYHIGMATSPALYRKLPYDTLNDFDYIGQIADVPMMLIAKKATPAANFAEFLPYAKANKDKLTYATAGLGSASHLCGMLLMSTMQAEFTTIPYKGTGPAMNDLVGGQTDFMCDQTTNTVPQIKSGNVKAYGVTTSARLPSLPDMPTLHEQGLTGFDLVVWNGLYVPKGTPKAAIDKLVPALQSAVQNPVF